MSGDFLVNLGKNKTARAMVKSLGLPVPLPQELARGAEARQQDFLAGKTIAIAGTGPLVERLRAEVAACGGKTGDAERVDGLVFDATTLAEPSELATLHGFFSGRLKSLNRCGRVIVLGRPASDTASVAHAATQRALLGLVKAIGREIGAKGSTANYIEVAEGSEAGAIGPARFLLSPRSAFITGQPFRVSGTVSADGSTWVAPLDGKVALVTGAARGIGASTAATLAAAGATVLVLDRPDDAEPLQATAEGIGGIAVACDVTAPDAAATILEGLKQTGKNQLDIVVHNAGVTRDRTLAKMDRPRWDLVMSVNLEAILALFDALPMADHGRIIALSSVSGIAGNMGQTNYSASKAGVIGFIEAAAHVHADRGVTVNGIAPGFIETRMTAAIPAAIREGGRRLSSLAQGGQPVDVAEAITFLATPDSAGLNGQVIRVCGGAFLGA
ncbi:MAG: 3-oxoacyl-ACP reductase [Myxococcota bacterium]